MFKHILMPTDGSGHSENAIKRGIELAKLCGSKVTGIHVVPDYRLTIADDNSFNPAVQEKMDEEARAQAENFLAFVKQTAGAQNVSCDVVIATNSQPFDAIINTAIERNCDLIVMLEEGRIVGRGTPEEMLTASDTEKSSDISANDPNPL